MNIFINYFTILFVLILQYVNCVKLGELFTWRNMEYAWPTQELRDRAIRDKTYIPENNLPVGLEVWKDKLFITVPRWKSGVVSSLNYVKLTNDGNQSPALIPYPSFEANTLPVEDPIEGRANTKPADSSIIPLKDNSTIVSTFRIRADECDRLWVMDTGLSDILGEAKQITPNALVIFDLNTNKFIRRFAIPNDQIKENTFFANVIVDTSSGDCDNAFAYVPDLGSYAVIVYSFKENKSWRVTHHFFHFDPLNGNYNVAGINFQWTDGIFGMALSKRNPNDHSRLVYFHPFSSTKEFVVSNLVLQNETYSQSSESYFDFKYLGERGPNSHSSAEFLDEKSGVLFYTQVNKDGIGCWNTNKQYTPDNQGLVDSDSNTLVFPNDVKVDTEGNLYVLSDRMPIFIYSELKPNVVNYRILKSSVSEAIKGTPCE